MSRIVLSSGPFRGVYATKDPGDARPDYAVDAKNVYVADPVNSSGFYARTKFRLLNDGYPVYAPSTPFRTQGIYCHNLIDGTPINLLVIGGQLFRVSDDLSTFTNITPSAAGIVIDPAISTRVFFASVVGTFTVVINDGLNRPWIGSSLTSTPVIGTYIDYDGHGVSWSMYGRPVFFQGSVFGILNQVNGISRRDDISWSLPGDASQGWQQDIFDYNWTLAQNEAGPLFCLNANNLGIDYFRAQSIGQITGPDVNDLASTATDDSLAYNIGSMTPQCVCKFGDGYFFIDQQGRPYWRIGGSAPDPIWKQMRSFVEAGTANDPTTTNIVATATIEPVNNQFLVAIWSPQPASQAPPIDIHVFDAQTRIYQGHWSVDMDEPVECLGVWQDAAGRTTLIAATSGGFLWSLTPLGIPVAIRTTQAGTVRVTQAGLVRTTEGSASEWEDDGGGQSVFVTTDRLGYNPSVNYNLDIGTVITSTQVPISVSVRTSVMPTTVEATPTPLNSADQTYRTVVGLDTYGRGPQVTVGPTDFSDQFVLQSVTVEGAASKASVGDQ